MSLDHIPLADPILRIAALFAGDGPREHLGTLSPAAHMLQAAAFAEAAGARPALVAATLLHDVGRFRRVLAGRPAGWGRDIRHSEAGADWLSQWFGDEVTGPVRLHVAAKRYLCAVEPGYHSALSAASARAIAAEGGPMNDGEMAAFEAHPQAYSALRLRRWDDEANDPAATAPAFGYYQPLLRRLLRGPAVC